MRWKKHLEDLIKRNANLNMVSYYEGRGIHIKITKKTPKELLDFCTINNSFTTALLIAKKMNGKFVEGFVFSPNIQPYAWVKVGNDYLDPTSDACKSRYHKEYISLIEYLPKEAEELIQKYNSPNILERIVFEYMSSQDEK
ncbi:MAG TPA: hypothetical protein VMZ29_01350 [Candidatus Bathyarchaeia archaeon]|nr:hypothetical protein [Candidatus Bathyarchaeia archaeon]